MLQPLPLDARLLIDVTELNRQFVRILLSANRAGRLPVEAELVRRLDARCAESADGWPGCPFLLFRVVAEDSRPAAVSLPCIEQHQPSVAGLITLTLGFLWQLARERPQAAQIVSGASRDWCEQLSDLTIAGLAGLSTRAALQPRLTDVPGFWQDLARKRGISALQRASLGAAGLQLIMSLERRKRATANSVLNLNDPSTHRRAR